MAFLTMSLCSSIEKAPARVFGRSWVRFPLGINFFSMSHVRYMRNNTSLSYYTNLLLFTFSFHVRNPVQHAAWSCGLEEVCSSKQETKQNENFQITETEHAIEKEGKILKSHLLQSYRTCVVNVICT